MFFIGCLQAVKKEGTETAVGPLVLNRLYDLVAKVIEPELGEPETLIIILPHPIDQASREECDARVAGSVSGEGIIEA